MLSLELSLGIGYTFHHSGSALPYMFSATTLVYNILLFCSCSVCILPYGSDALYVPLDRHIHEWT